jgi:hypothetical protein
MLVDHWLLRRGLSRRQALRDKRLAALNQRHRAPMRVFVATTEDTRHHERKVIHSTSRILANSLGGLRPFYFHGGRTRGRGEGSKTGRRRSKTLRFITVRRSSRLACGAWHGLFRGGGGGGGGGWIRGALGLTTRLGEGCRRNNRVCEIHAAWACRVEDNFAQATPLCVECPGG